MDRSWSALEIDLPLEVGELALGVVGEQCLGAELRSTGGHGTTLVAYFATTAAANEAGKAVELLLRTTAPDARHDAPVVREVEDGRWVERYQASLQPQKVGRRFLVDPTGGEVAAGDRTSIALIPGRAFGTGEHATTRLCIEALERHVEPGSRWVDLGCGSGILAVAAAHCGAREVLALDLDPEAVQVAREVVERNGVSRVARVLLGTQDDVPAGQWDGVVANITASYFVDSTAAVAVGLRKGGTLIASGIPSDERRGVRSSLVACGLVEVEQATRDGWSAIVVRRPDGKGT